MGRSSKVNFFIDILCCFIKQVCICKNFSRDNASRSSHLTMNLNANYQTIGLKPKPKFKHLLDFGASTECLIGLQSNSCVLSLVHKTVHKFSCPVHQLYLLCEYSCTPASTPALSPPSYLPPARAVSRSLTVGGAGRLDIQEQQQKWRKSWWSAT